jgi:hypothetical protein
MNFRMTSASCCVLIGPKRLHVERSLTFLDDVSIAMVKKCLNFGAVPALFLFILTLFLFILKNSYIL